MNSRLSFRDDFFDFTVKVAQSETFGAHYMLAVGQNQPGKRFDAPGQPGFLWILYDHPDREGNAVVHSPFMEGVLIDL